MSTIYTRTEQEWIAIKIRKFHTVISEKILYNIHYGCNNRGGGRDKNNDIL